MVAFWLEGVVSLFLWGFSSFLSLDILGRLYVGMLLCLRFVWGFMNLFLRLMVYSYP